MKRKFNSLSRQLALCSVIACFAVVPAFAGTTDIANVPLASGTPLPPNVLFTLDDSGSMNSDYLPDYVNDNNTCMPTSGGATACQRGDPPFEAGGQFGFNGVSYDPNYTYLPGVSSNGLPVVNPPTGALTATSLVQDAYLGGGNVNLNTTSVDKRFCNQNNLCKRNGAQDPAVSSNPAPVISGSDAQGHVLTAGQFPYRSHASNSSQAIFAMPETMVGASFARTLTTVTVSTSAPHGLTTANRIFVPTPASLAVTCVAVTSVPNASAFTYTAASSGTVAATAASYRKCDAGNFSRATSVVTVNTGSNHGLATNDVVTTFVAAGNAMNAAGVNVTVTSATSFTYTSGTSGTIASIAGLWVRTGLYNVASSVTGYPMAYRVTPVEYCSDVALTTCVEVIPPAAPPVGFPNPAYVRFCKTLADALAPGAVTGTSGAPATSRCQLKYVNIAGLQAYVFPRFGWFTRDSITSAALTPNFGGRPTRTDAGCSASTCSYAAEIQNYASWYTYYRKRMQMMKTATGRAFLSFISNPGATPPRPDTLRVGFITINPFFNNASGSSNQGSVQASKYLKISNFSSVQASSWYTKLYSIIPDQSTPLRLALSRAGWIFAGKLNNGLTLGIPAADDPLQASCQRNFNILTTDGFWNQGTGQDIAGNTLLNQDNTDNQVIAPYTDFMVSRSTGTYDGAVLSGTTAGATPGGAGTLADIALYYYKTDLRNAGAGPLTSPSTTPAGADVSNNNVPAKAGNKDFVTHQHMNTYTLGLADGLMRYQTDYETANNGDFFNIKNGTVGACFWAPGAVCNWPSPQADGQSAIDDLWHAAVNGRGTFYRALNANELTQGLANTLGNLNAQIAAAAASATSSPNITQTDNQIFSTTYQTNTWSGRVFAQTIDPVTGNVNPTIQWQADTQILLQTGASTDSRRIFTVNPLTSGLMNFTYVNVVANTLTGNEKNYFQKKCTLPAPNAAMSQCASLTLAQKISADDGNNMINFLRGQNGNEAGPGCLSCVYRDRQEIDPLTNAVTQTVFGDTISAKPTFVRAATFDYADSVTPTYASFRTSVASRAARLYVGANDGYLHAFNALTGDEVWAYAPRFLLPGIYQLADQAYSANHRFFVDGSPETGDIYDVSAGRWKTVLVGGAGAGGRGFYALDITDENTPLLLWEFCADSTLCANNDPDLGFSYGDPVFGKRASDGKWVVVLSSGLNNVSPGTGGGFFFVLDAITGAVLNKIPTQISAANVGTVGTPSGLMKLSGYYDNALKDATFRYVYAGDQLGNIWRMDVTVNPPTVLHIATLKDSTGRAQPITTRMALTHIGSNRIIYVGTGRYLGASDLSDPGLASGIAWQQSIYAIKDKVVDAASDYGPNIRVGSNFVTQTLINASTTTRTTSTLPVDWNTRDGWLIDLNPGNATPGERVNVDPELIIGTLVIASNIPATSAACTVGGESFLYQFDFKTGQYVVNSLNNVAGQLLGGLTVGMAIIQLPSGVIKDIVTSADTSKSSQGVNVGAASAYLRRFSYRER